MAGKQLWECLVVIAFGAIFCVAGIGSIISRRRNPQSELHQQEKRTAFLRRNSWLSILILLPLVVVGTLLVIAGVLCLSKGEQVLRAGFLSHLVPKGWGCIESLSFGLFIIALSVPALISYTTAFEPNIRYQEEWSLFFSQHPKLGFLRDILVAAIGIAVITTGSVWLLNR